MRQLGLNPGLSGTFMMFSSRRVTWGAQPMCQTRRVEEKCLALRRAVLLVLFERQVCCKSIAVAAIVLCKQNLKDREQ